MEPIVEIKSNLNKIFPNAARLWQKIIQSQHKTVRRAVSTNVSGRKSSSELFPLAPTHAKLANSGKSEVR